MTLQEEVDARNAETSRQEVATFLSDPPEKYTAYVKLGTEHYNDPKRGIFTFCWVTTWTGDTLASGAVGPKVHDNFGGYRRYLWCQGINRVEYYGWYYDSSGDYCRISAYKHQLPLKPAAPKESDLPKTT